MFSKYLVLAEAKRARRRLRNLRWVASGGYWHK